MARKEDFFDRLLGLSPQISEEPASPYVLVSLAPVASYWKLYAFVARPTLDHPFRQALEAILHPADFSAGAPFACVLTTQAIWARWLLARRCNAPSDPDPMQTNPLLEIWSADRVRATLLESPLLQASPLIADQLSSAEDRAAADFMFESLLDLGVERVRAFEALPSGALFERFGPLSRCLLRRLHGSDDLSPRFYEPTPVLTARFHPHLESLSDSPEDPDVLARLESLLHRWEQRLAGRRALLKGLRIRVRSERRAHNEALFVTFPRPTREARTLFPIVREKWMSLVRQCAPDPERSLDAHAFADEIDEVTVESLGLEADRDAQMDLFDPDREARSEAWNALIGRLSAKSTPAQPVHVGFPVPVASYIPEHAFEWTDWRDDGAPVPMIPDPPRRPLVLFDPPVRRRQPLLRSEEEFFTFVRWHQALATLERITVPALPPLFEGQQDRSYARIGTQWIFWDHLRKGLYTHGVFESPALPHSPRVQFPERDKNSP